MISDIVSIDQTWKQRHGALDMAIEAVSQDLERRLEISQASLAPRRCETLKTLLRLTQYLRAFSREHFSYFENVFGNGTFKKTSEHPPEEVFRGILDEVGHDLEVIQRAADPRFTGSTEMLTVLDTAEQLAWAALNPACDLWIEESPTVITYFAEKPSIRFVPYAEVALVAVPFYCLSNPLDYLAIPHEIGHYVYKRGYEARLIQSAQQFVNLPRWCTNWVKEIFADLYGCLVAGPLIALDFQDLQRSESDDDFVREDGRHPVGALRPEVYTKILRRIEEPKGVWPQGWADALEQNWASILDARWGAQPPDTFRLHKEDSVTHRVTKELDDARDILDDVIGRLFQIGFTQIPHSTHWKDLCPSGPEASVDVLYEDFREKLCELSVEPLSNVAEWASRPETAWTTWFDKLKAKLNNQEPTWKEVWLTDDWTIDPPTPNWP